MAVQITLHIVGLIVIHVLCERLFNTYSVCERISGILLLI